MWVGSKNKEKKHNITILTQINMRSVSESLYVVLIFENFFEVSSESLYIETLWGLQFQPLEALCPYI